MTMFRFTLRSLLTLVTLGCVGLGVWTYRAGEQRRIVNVLRNAGATAFYDSAEAEAATMAWPPVQWLGIDHFKSVRGVSGCPIGLMEEATRLDTLITLEIVGDSSPHRFDCLTGLTRLRSLVIHSYSPGLDDDAMRCIAGLPALERVALSGDPLQITAAGIESLAHSKSLTDVSIFGCSEDLSSDDLAPLRKSRTIKHGRVVRGYRFSAQVIDQWGQ
jgi:hypothetical protein